MKDGHGPSNQKGTRSVGGKNPSDFFFCERSAVWVRQEQASVGKYSITFAHLLDADHRRMGKSAKLHKRNVMPRFSGYLIFKYTIVLQISKTKSSTSKAVVTSASKTTSHPASQTLTPSIKRREELLKSKPSKFPTRTAPVTTNANSTKFKSNLKKTQNGNVLGDVDYVDLMMGGRRKAANEAEKMELGM